VTEWKPGIYRLAAAVRNPQADSRYRYDYWCREAWGVGETFKVYERDWGALFIRPITQCPSERHIHCRDFADVAALLLPALVPVSVPHGDLTLAVNGQPFRCDCGCNVFRRTPEFRTRYVCNACRLEWLGETDKPLENNHA
jgi:hypothetical protein